MRVMGVFVAWFREGVYALRERWRYPDFRPRLLRSAYRVCREGGGGVYGETPLHVACAMVEAAGIGERDVVYELGCGRGRVALFLRYFTGCRVVGIDCVKQFIEESVKGEGVEFVYGDYLKADLSRASVIYLYGTCLEDEEIMQLLGRLPINCRVVTISYPLTDYSDRVRVLGEFDAQFIWGKTRGYVNEILG